MGSRNSRLCACTIFAVAFVLSCASPHAAGEANEALGVDEHATPVGDLQAQSPIDIPDSASAGAAHHRVEMHYHETVERIIHREHTVEIEVGGADGNGIDFDGKTYLLGQFHFHTPSEHLVAGERFPIELHLVHRSSSDEVLVVGVLFRSGEPSTFLEQILTDAPVSIGRVDRDKSLDVNELFPEESHFYSYRGSFTTPPYTEGVDWLVLRSNPEASSDQIVRLLLLEGGNARDVQEQNDRPVEEF